jgi:hypothetical protein
MPDNMQRRPEKHMSRPTSRTEKGGNSLKTPEQLKNKPMVEIHTKILILRKF